MRKNKHIFILCTACFFAVSLYSQNQPSFEQYHFNQQVINPAYAGSGATFEADLFYHQQWVKMPGAPETISGTVNTKLSNDKIGVGLKLLQESIGATNSFQIGIQYAYRIHIKNVVVAIGLEASATNYHLNFQDLTAYIDGDPAFTNQPENTWSPNAGAGIWINTKKFYAGLSAPVVFEDSVSGATNHDISQLNIFEASRHYYFSTGILIGNQKTFAVKPYTLVKYVPDAPMQIDGNLSFIFKNSFWFGGSYRTDNSVTIMAEYFANSVKTLQDQIFGFGYAYHFSLEDVQSYLGPTHEIFITYSLDKHNTRYTNPRFF